MIWSAPVTLEEVCARTARRTIRRWVRQDLRSSPGFGDEQHRHDIWSSGMWEDNLPDKDTRGHTETVRPRQGGVRVLYKEGKLRRSGQSDQ